MNLPPLPSRMQKLRLNEKGYPVPWFVEWIDGKPDFRVMDGKKWIQAVQLKVCWVCGEPLGKFLAFVIGPMCAVNRTSSEPPSHRDCAIFSATACPFMTEPERVRRETNLPDGKVAGGIGLKRNPGVALVWITRNYKVYPVKADAAHGVEGGALIQIGEPEECLWFAQGRKATRAEVMASIESGLPLLMKTAEDEGPEAVQQLTAQADHARSLVPAA